MGRKQDGLTSRQRQSQQVMQAKAARKRREVLWRRFSLAFGAVAFLVVVGGSVWFIGSGTAIRLVTRAVDGAYKVTVDAGYGVKTIYLEGRNRTPVKEFERALDVRTGDPILRLSIGEIRERLEAIESVRFAAVERELPGTLHIRIVEREPVARWQHEGNLALADDTGAVMKGLDLAPYRHLPLIVGKDAPAHVSGLVEMLALRPELAKRFEAAIRVGERRWNVRLDGGVEVRLPQDGAQEAWLKLMELHDTQKLLDRDVRVIDLRVPERLFITLPPHATPESLASARET